MGRARRARDGVRSPADRSGCGELDAGPDPARRRCPRAGNTRPRRAVRALFSQAGRYEPAGLERRDGAGGGFRGLRTVRTHVAGGLSPPSRSRKEKTMTSRERYAPGPATGAQVRKEGDKWTLVLVREMRHSPEKVWQALTDPAHLREWAPFDADGSLRSEERRVGR